MKIPRALRRQIERESKANKGAGTGLALKAAQALSREELDTALGNYGGLMGASNFGPDSRVVRVVNRKGIPVVVMAEISVLPDPQDGDGIEPDRRFDQ